ncbi:hypothetical protein Lal_00009082 [Lupinus albus]|nr:hypothetical protein Lal_00009082 [Lupinus albus]
MTNSRVEGSSGRAARKLRFALMGPAFIAAIGYIDPGNFATNIQAGASFGYKLLWVVVWANLMAMLIQMLSAKLGIATGKNLAEQIRDHYPRPAVWLYWVQAEIIAMATDLAEFIGAAIGFKLILGVSLLQGAVLTGIATFLILMLQRRGQKPLEKVIGGLLLFVAAAYIVELIFSQPNLAQLGKGMAIPSLPTSEAVFLAAGVLGATIMPHVIYLHSSLTQHLHGGTRKERYSATKWDVAIAMTIAGFVNLAMMATAAAAFHFNGHTGIADLDQAYLTLEPPGGDAGVCPVPYSAVGSSFRHHAAVICGDSDGTRPNANSGHEPGAAEFWYCAGAGAAADLYQQQNSDGRAGQLNAGETNRVGHRGGGRGAEPVVVSGNRAGSLTKKGAVEAPF